MGLLDWLFGSPDPPRRRRRRRMTPEEHQRWQDAKADAARVVREAKAQIKAEKAEQRRRAKEEQAEAARRAREERERRAWEQMDRSYAAGRLMNPRLSVAERNSLPDSAFAAPGIRALPIHDAGHVRSSLGHFSQQVFRNRSEAQAAARRIVEAAQKHGVPVRASSTVARMAGAYVEKTDE